MNKTIQELDVLLADFHVFYQNLRNYHWNVTGPQFFQLHELFEKLYDGVSEHIDNLAERILTLGGKPTHTLKGYLAMATLKEDEETPAAVTMVDRVAETMKALNQRMLEIAGHAADQRDPGTAMMLEDIVADYEKTLWMIRATRS